MSVWSLWCLPYTVITDQGHAEVAHRFIVSYCCGIVVIASRCLGHCRSLFACLVDGAEGGMHVTVPARCRHLQKQMQALQELAALQAVLTTADVVNADTSYPGARAASEREPKALRDTVVLDAAADTHDATGVS